MVVVVLTPVREVVVVVEAAGTLKHLLPKLEQRLLSLSVLGELVEHRTAAEALVGTLVGRLYLGRMWFSLQAVAAGLLVGPVELAVL